MEEQDGDVDTINVRMMLLFRQVKPGETDSIVICFTREADGLFHGQVHPHLGSESRFYAYTDKMFASFVQVSGFIVDENKNEMNQEIVTAEKQFLPEIFVVCSRS